MTATKPHPVRPEPVRPEAVRRKVAAWLTEADGTDAIALHAAPVWDADPVMLVGGIRLRVVPCPTPLAARAALHDRAGDEKLVLLTDLADAVLGDSLLAHLSRQSVRSLNAWELVRQMFGGVTLDPSLPSRRKWLPAALADHLPADGWPAPPGTVLTRDHALRCLTAELLGIDRDQLDASGLLQWTTKAQAQQQFNDTVASDVADGITSYLADVAGTIVGPVMAAVRAGHGVDTIPLGLLAAILWPSATSNGTTGNRAVPAPRDTAADESGVAVAIARTRLEPWFGGLRMTPIQAATLRDSAEAWVGRALDSDHEPTRQDGLRMLRRAETIAAEIDVSPRLALSSLLPGGALQRLRRFASAVRTALPPAGTTAVPPVSEADLRQAEATFTWLGVHRAGDPKRLATARMALRLLRWLGRPDGPPPATLHDAVARQVTIDGWVDRARLDIFAGDVDAEVADAYQRLHRAVDARRTRHDAQFATLLAEITRPDAEPGRLLRVEDVLDRVVRPLLDAGRQVLLLVMDGMSVAAATELGESVTRNGTWLELTPDAGPRAGVLAALPTVTEASRCSLLSGALSVGDRTTERDAFQRRFPNGRLLHKNDLRAAAGAALDTDVRVAIDDPNVPIVAAVINTIDDALDRSEPGTTVWGDDSIPAVRDLLAVAERRVVVIVSDHGHVVDRGPDGATRPSESRENRWRPATTPATEGEILIAGRRVLLGGGEVVLPWREDLRYGPRKAGYHGGAAPAEVVIPLLVLTAGDDQALPGWGPAPVASPDWWREPLPEKVETPPSQAGTPSMEAWTLSAEAGAPSVQAGRRSRKPVASGPPTLFEVGPASAEPAQAPPDPNRALIDALLASDRYAQRRDSRAPLGDDRVAAMLGVLLAGNGRAGLETLAAQAGVPAYRINGAVTALRKLLQVEGYPVLTMDPDGQTVLLDRILLVEQFELGPS